MFLANFASFRFSVFTWICTILVLFGIFFIAYPLLSNIRGGLNWLLSIFNLRRASVEKKDAKNDGKKENYLLKAAMRLRIQLRLPEWLMPTAMAIAGLLYLVSQNFLALLPIALFFLGRQWYSGIVKQKERKDVWAFLLDLRTRISLTGSLLTALRSLAADGQTVTAQILRLYINAGYTTNGVTLLSMVSKEVQLPYLDDLVARANAAKSGSISMDSAIADSISVIQSEVQFKTREDLQKVPSRLVMFVFPCILAPMLIMLLYPIVEQVIASLSGSMTGGGMGLFG
jgi:hypothetical protein